MNQSDLKEKIIKIISNHKTGVLSTVEGNKPHSRYMTFYQDDLTLLTPMKANTEKIAELEKNPYVSVLLGYELKGLNDSYVQITGTAKVSDSQALKQQYWDDSLQNWFAGPKDPNFVLLQIQPEIIRVLNNEGGSVQELNV